MLSLGFLNPMLLWALPLAAVPIIIHILNRRRFKKVPWAAMDFLLAAMKRNRKRLRMEQWLVLLLRTLAVLFLIFLVSRPQLTGGGLVGVQTHHVVLLDDSASMTQRSGAATLFEKARDRIRTLADRLGQSRSGDLFSLIRASNATEPELLAERIGPDLGRRIGQMVKELPAGDTVMDLGELLTAARLRAKGIEQAGRTEYYLVTDVRERDWLTAEGRARPEVVAQIVAMKTDEEHVTVLPMGSGEASNLAVVGVRREDRVAVAGVPATLMIDVANWGLEDSAPTEVAVEVDGKSRVVRPVEPIPPGQTTSIPIAHTFHAPGFHRVDASLPATDRFPIDDRRSLAIEVLDRSRVLLVDGDPGDAAEEAETFFLAAALDPGGDAVSGIEAQVVSDLGLQEQDLSEFGLVWMCNVPAPSEQVIERLEKYVAAGGGLVFFLGNQVEPSRYNEAFYKRGVGLLPLPLDDVRGDPDRPEHGFLAAKEHPIVGRLPEALELLFAHAVLVKRHMAMAEDPKGTATTVVRVGDAEGSPLIASRPFGDGGEVVAIGVSADPHWSTWPATDAYLIICNEIHRSGVKVQDLTAFNLSTRGTYRIELDPGLYKPDVIVRATDDSGEERTFTAVQPASGAASGADPGAASGADPGTDPGTGTEQPAANATVEVSMTELRGLGAFEVVLQGHGGGTDSQMLARNPPVEEGLLHRLTQSAFGRQFPPAAGDRVTFLDEGSGAGDPGSGEGEIWRLLAMALLVGLLLESLLAWRFGRR